jgi:sporulation protein YlmC with PRC-barrel domain
MLQRLAQLRAATVHALDGEIGTVEDFYFDDERWTIRYVVVSTGRWLSERSVLLSVISILSPDWGAKRLPVRLTREQVRKSPDVDTYQPVSRAQEAAILSHYSYPYYWSGPALWGPVPFPAIAADTATVGLLRPPAPAASEHDQRLRSCEEVVGYHVHARDGTVGQIDDFVVDPQAWTIEYVLIDTGDWIGGRPVIIEPTVLRRISWLDHTIDVALP